MNNIIHNGYVQNEFSSNSKTGQTEPDFAQKKPKNHNFPEIDNTSFSDRKIFSRKF